MPDPRSHLTETAFEDRAGRTIAARQVVEGGAKQSDTRKGRLTEADLNEIETIALDESSEGFRGPLLALIDEVRRLREMILDGRGGAMTDSTREDGR